MRSKQALAPPCLQHPGSAGSEQLLQSSLRALAASSSMCHRHEAHAIVPRPVRFMLVWLITEHPTASYTPLALELLTAQFTCQPVTAALYGRLAAPVTAALQESVSQLRLRGSGGKAPGATAQSTEGEAANAAAVCAKLLLQLTAGPQASSASGAKLADLSLVDAAQRRASQRVAAAQRQRHLTQRYLSTRQCARNDPAAPPSRSQRRAVRRIMGKSGLEGIRGQFTAAQRAKAQRKRTAAKVARDARVVPLLVQLLRLDHAAATPCATELVRVLMLERRARMQLRDCGGEEVLQELVNSGASQVQFSARDALRALCAAEAGATVCPVTQACYSMLH